MVTVLIFIALGLLTQAVVLATSQNIPPRFTENCATCGYQIPPMEYPPAFHDCPNCQRLMSLGVDLSEPLLRR